LKTAEKSMDQLGRVNPLALEEFAALEQRHQFLAEQLADLEKTRLDLMQIIEELITLAKDLDAATKAGQEMGLTEDEKAFYDALAVNDSAKTAMGDDKLKVIAAELISQVKKSVTIDWTLRDGLREIPIEERSPDEVRYISGWDGEKIQKVLLTPADSPAANYGFDVTPARLVTALITERGICPATETGMLSLFPEFK
jgi:translation initiation factor 2B subunit (eIF-2B alpha/beta/delta family)